MTSDNGLPHSKEFDHSYHSTLIKVKNFEKRVAPILAHSLTPQYDMTSLNNVRHSAKSIVNQTTRQV